MPGLVQRIVAQRIVAQDGILRRSSDSVEPEIVCQMAGSYIMFNSLGIAKVAELVDAPDLGSGTERCGGSSPPFRTMLRG